MTSSGGTHRTIWVDVEDLFQYFSSNPHPSGIQRLVFEILNVLPERARVSAEQPRIAFVRHTGDDALLREVTFDSVVGLFSGRPSMAVGKPAPAKARLANQPQSRVKKGLQKTLRLRAIWLIEQLPAWFAEPLLEAGVLQLTVLRYASRLVRRPSGPAAPEPPPAIAPPPPLGPKRPAAGFQGKPGDVFLVLGAPWVHADYGTLLRRLRAQYQVEPTLLLYDLIPVRRPEWVTIDLGRNFAAWLQSTLPHCDQLMAISKATAADVEGYASEFDVTLAGPVRPIPLGTGLGLAVQRAAGAGPRPRGLPAPGSYVLFVSTLEARKNHALLFRVWRRLLAEMPYDQVPTLVFAGRLGWLVADLMQQLENAGWLGGKIRLLRDPTDAELMALYRGCKFTVFPSLYEGWGLPVSESLALGCPCVTSNRTSLPEAGGELARYFDPENLDDAYAVIRAVIDDPAGLEAWRERVRTEFRIVPWEATADAILKVCTRSSVALLSEAAV